ncbi:MAG: type pilus assembly PilZ [Fibrobacteres bacterium]|nr:type pilus assembly PilZ [Fibrobacterota bacterium]
MGKKSVKTLKRQPGLVQDPASPGIRGDWSKGSPVDVSKLATGIFKFPGTFEHRSQERISQRELGNVSMEIREPGKETWIPVKLWDFTSISFGILYQRPEPMAGAPEEEAQRLHLSEGDDIQIRIRVRPGQEFQVWCQVKNKTAWKEGIRIGLRRMDVATAQSVEYDRRIASRLALSPSLSLRARVKHPFIFSHWSPMSVSDVNKDMGLSFHSNDHSILVFEGMELEIHFDLASFRNVPMTARVIWVHATEAHSVKFGVVCLAMEWNLHNSICGFLLHSQQWTPQRLKDEGFQARHVKSHLRFRAVRTMDEYAQVLHLRRDAYVGAGKRFHGTTPEEMATPLDGISRILIAHHRGRLVGTMTFTFPSNEDTMLDSQTGFPGRKYPVKIPPKANLIEVSRLCIHDEYRGTDLLQGLFEHGLKHFLMSDRHWLLTSAVDELLPIYERIGFKRLQASYKHPRLNNKEHHLILAHRNAFLFGAGINIFIWNVLFGDLIRYLIDRGLIKVIGPIRVLVRLKLFFLPLSKLATESKARRSFRKHIETLRRISRPDSEDPSGPEEASPAIPD